MHGNTRCLPLGWTITPLVSEADFLLFKQSASSSEEIFFFFLREKVKIKPTDFYPNILEIIQDKAAQVTILYFFNFFIETNQ